MRLVFLGSPPAAVPTLRAVVDAGHEVRLVVSGPDKRRGRGAARTPTAVKAAALDLGLDVTDDLDAVGRVGAELGVVVAYGRIIPASLLEQVPMVNLHFSLLPRWRGAAPVERAILSGDAETGVCVMDVAEGLDTGDVHAVATVAIDDEVTASELTGRLAELGADLLVGALADGLGPGVAQSGEGVTYAHKIRAEDRCLDWALPAAQLARIVRIGGAWTTFRDGRFKVLAATPAAPSTPATPVPQVSHGTVSHVTVSDGTVSPGTVWGTAVVCGDGDVLELQTVQPQGKAAIDAAAWANGARADGERLGSGG